MRKIAFFLLLLTASLVTAAQSQTAIQPFQILRAYGPFRITLVESDRERIEVSYQGIDKEEVVIDADDGILDMRFRSKHYWDNWNSSGNHKNRNVSVTVYFKQLNEIEVKAGASVTSEATLSSTSLRLVASMGAEMRLDVKTKELELDSSMGSDVTLSGTTATLEINSKMGSTVKAIRLTSDKVRVKAYMGSDVTVYASQELDASAGFGAVINFGGEPSVRNTDHSFGGVTNATKR
jgi:Putative auto-transporter adhesin, head GIN domain